MEKQRDFVTGFNDGYLLQQKEPEIAQFINQSIEAKDDYLKGRQAGREQYLTEFKERLRAGRQQAPESSRNKGRDQPIDR